MSIVVKFSIMAVALAALASAPLQAGEADEDVQLVKCEAPYGSIAIAEGAQQGWSEYKLPSPTAMLNSLIVESGCFTLHNPASGEAADFLMTAVAGSQEEVDQSVQMAKSAATEAMIRSGAAGSVLSKVPMGGALMGMFGGLGGKKKTIFAGLSVMDPRNGRQLVAATGQSQKSTIKILQSSDLLSNSGGYDSKDGRMVTSAFIQSYNGVVAQASILASVIEARQQQGQGTPQGSADSGNHATVAADSQMRASPAAEAAVVRELRSGTELTLTGQRKGVYVECEDKFGTKGWVSVEDLK